MKRDDLTDRQREVVESSEKVVLVLGDPGTGKTSTALWAAHDALGRPSVDSWQRVLFLTFSRTAVAQIARHAPGVFSGARDRIEISTFHAFAYRLLRAFGRYAGFGATLQPLQSEARAKLFGRQGLTYDDLVPAALRILGSARVHELVATRWPVVICDEFQDTNSEQWELLKVLGKRSRLILLADPNQMIYTFIPGVGPKRLEEARELADGEVELEPKSHRDPTGIIPALGTAVRCRDFDHEAVRAALESRRLRIFVGVEDDRLMDTIVPEVKRLRAGGASVWASSGTRMRASRCWVRRSRKPEWTTYSSASPRPTEKRSPRWRRCVRAAPASVRRKNTERPSPSS